MALSNKRKTKALIRLLVCAGWSVIMLVADTEDRFSRVEARIEGHTYPYNVHNIHAYRKVGSFQHFTFILANKNKKQLLHMYIDTSSLHV